jgi:hypothetical protein
VADHPIQIVVQDDLRRSRLTVFFRLLLAIPHFVWLFLWTIAAVVAVIVNWFATLARGRSPQALHNFLGAYVRYTTHLYAYLYLAANPWPGFTGSPGSYPVDVRIAERAPQSRWTTLLRLVLVLPALLLAGVLAGGGGGGGGGGGSSGEEQDTAYQVGAFFGSAGAVATVVAVLAWFACLARARMPGGFRDLLVWTLRYGAQTHGYLFLLTDRYPNSEPYDPRAARPDRPLAVRLAVTDDLRRSRLTVVVRLLLAFPHYVWAALWGIAAFLAAVANWVVTLVAGRPLLGLHRFLAAFLRYQAHVYSFLTLAANPFPGFTGTPGYPLDLDIDEPAAQKRLVTFFRLLLALPAYLVANALGVALFVVAVFSWFTALVLGRVPEGLRNVSAYAIHYWAQLYGYLYLLTDRYPYSGPVTGSEEPVAQDFTWPFSWPFAASDPA